MDAPYYALYVGEKLWTVMPAAALVQQHVATFEDFPPRQASSPCPCSSSAKWPTQSRRSSASHYRPSSR
jgi:hypothetical protein